MCVMLHLTTEVRKGLSERRLYLSKDLKEVGESHGDIWGTGNSKCKGPEVGSCFLCPRSSREASVGGLL